jgi:hypothetical protein
MRDVFIARIKQVTSKKTKTSTLWMLGMAASAVHQCRSVGLPVHDSQGSKVGIVHLTFALPSAVACLLPS